MMQIRRPTVDDAPDIASIHVSAWQAAYRGIVPDAFLDALSVDQREARWSDWFGGLLGELPTATCAGPTTLRWPSAWPSCSWERTGSGPRRWRSDSHPVIAGAGGTRGACSVLEKGRA